jgi:hypothetical protein
MLTEKQQSAAAKRFAEKWHGKGYEKGDSQIFWTELLTEVFGIEDPSTFIRFEEQVKVDKTNFIDVHLPQTKVIIEQKSLGKDLRAPIRQSDGSLLTPFQQGKRYNAELPYSQRARWIVTCNFAEFLVYDMEQPNGEPEQILLENLGKEYYRLQFLVDSRSEHLSKEMEVSMKAGEIVGKLYDELLKQYIDPTNPHSLKSLNVLCVRLVFCLYAEDAGIFGRHDMFHDFLNNYPTEELRSALIRLFKVMDTPVEERDPYLREDLLAFPYTNGGLFADEQIEIPRMTDTIRQLLLQNASLDFDWSEISPTIFGAVFESTLNPETRRSGGMHYTSIENIHKVIDPLFLNDLRSEFDTILTEKVERQRQRKLSEFQVKLASLTFLDPACGSGNFLTETYLSLRRLENEVIREMYHGQTMMGAFVNPIKVSIQQFYGIEINDFAVTVATTALWISEAQMLAETERIIHQDIDFLPLKSYTNIREGNALHENWNLVERYDTSNIGLHPKTQPAFFPNTQSNEFHVTLGERREDEKDWKQGLLVYYDYILGNPPFVGARQMSKEQKEDVLSIFGADWKNVGNLDYVCCWYKKAYQARCIGGAKVAFVSTNSICQGEQVANLWKPLMQKGLCIDFAYRTFRWDSEAKIKAHVHCVIVGFSMKEGPKMGDRIFIPGITKPIRQRYDPISDMKEGVIYDNDKIIKAKNINAYLIDAPNIFIDSSPRPICEVPYIGIGNLPIDGGNYLFTKEEKEDFIKLEPLSAQYFKLWYGSEEFIHQKPRYCLWLGECSPAELRRMPYCMKRIEAVREMRLASNRPGTRKLADRPTRFSTENMPDSNYVIIPKVSSEKRRYVPMGFMSPDVLASDLVFIIPDATLYHFGILESNVHMAWMRAVCGRLKSDYRYSKDVVYNNFPWPTPTDRRREKIEQSAQAILDARALYPDSSLADLYDERTMPVELRKAHQQNDRAVMEAYGFPVKNEFTESQCVAELFKLYQELTEKIS